MAGFPVDLTMCHSPIDRSIENPDTPWEVYRVEEGGARAERVRKGLWELGNIALRAQYGEEVSGPWSRYVYTPRRNADGNVEILVRWTNTHDLFA
jgi:hypothetical protein